MTNPRISIIVPCYNVEKYIDNALESILNQTYGNWECIVVNDGSSDQTENKIKEWTHRDQRFKLISQENKGLSGARNSGLMHVNGDCVYFFDPDDLLDIVCLKNLSDLFHPSIDIVIGKNAEVYNQTTHIIKTLEHVSITNKTMSDMNFIELSLKDPFSVVAWNKLYSSNFISSNKLSFKNGILHEDELWFFETLYLAKKIIFSSKVTYYYNIDNQNSITKNYSFHNLTSYLTVIENIYNSYYSKEHNEESKKVIGTYILNLQIPVISGFYRFLKKNKSTSFKIEGVSLIRNHIKKYKINAYININTKKSKQFELFIKYSETNPEMAFKLIRNTNKRTILKYFENKYLINLSRNKRKP